MSVLPNTILISLIAVICMVPVFDAVDLDVPTEKTATVGSDVTLDCEYDLASGEEIVKYYWIYESTTIYSYFLNTAAVTIDDAYTDRVTAVDATNSASIRLSSPTMDDRGDYMCTVTLSDYNSHQATMTLHVAEQTTISEMTTSYEDTLNETDSFWLYCDASGDPEPSITWYHDDEVSDMGDRDGFNLTFYSVNWMQHGSWYCEADNGIGSGASSDPLAVYVNHAPRDRMSIEITRADIDSTETLYCDMTAYPDIETFKWYKSNVKIENDSKYKISSSASGGTSTLEISDIEEDDFDTYLCMATNDRSTGSVNIELKEDIDIVGDSSSPLVPTVVSLLMLILHRVL